MAGPTPLLGLLIASLSSRGGFATTDLMVVQAAGAAVATQGPLSSLISFLEAQPLVMTDGMTILNNGSVLPPNFAAVWGDVALAIATDLGQSAVVGYVNNNLPPATFQLPAAINGAADINSVGNQASGVYGVSQLYASAGTGVAAEFTARNFGGAPDTNLPPNESIGTPTCASVSLQVTAGGNYNSSIGISVGSEGGSSMVHNTAIYVRNYAQYGLFVESQATGNQTSAVLKNNGAGINLEILTTGSFSANNAVMEVVDASSTSRLSIRQNGDVYLNNIYNSVSPVSALPAATAGARAFVSDSTVAGSGNFGAIVAGSGSNPVPVYADGTNWRIG